MPRLLPRLLKWLERNPPSQPDYRGPLTKVGRRRPRSMWRPTPSVESYVESFSVRNRHQSLLVDDGNIITSPKENTRHKTLPPVLRLKKSEVGRRIDYDTPREMTEQEKQWWSSPYLRMLSSPDRRCLLSDRHLPTDFLIRLVTLRLPSSPGSQDSAILVPDGLLHPKFAKRVYGRGHYLTCWKEALRVAIDKGSYKRFVPNLSVHSLLSEQVSHQLRQRVLQELDVLAESLMGAPREFANEVVLRRLTRSEWLSWKETGRIPWEGAACVLVVPPLNKNVHSKDGLPHNEGNALAEESGTQPTLHTNDSPPASIEAEISEAEPNATDGYLRPSPPLSVLHAREDSAYDEPLEFLQDEHLPHHRVPLYNGISLFPLRPERGALHEKLCKILEVDRQVRWKHHLRSNDEVRNEKPSHAFVVFSTGKSVRRADTVPLAIALWRIRMWEGAGWGECSWMLRK